MSFECGMVWVTPEKGSAPQRLQVSGEIFYTIFICPQRFAFSAPVAFFLSFFSQFFSHFCCTRRVLQKQIRRKLYGFVVFDTAFPPTGQGENEKRDEINVEVNEEKNIRETRRKINFILSISSAVFPLSLFLSL